MSFTDRQEQYRERIEQVLDDILPDVALPPGNLHEAMRYSVLGGGKRIRPLLVYATGEMLGVPADILDAPAAAVELIHAFSLVHDDLPAMDDDDLRRGKPTTHRAFDEATAILAADALQPLAFQTLVEWEPLQPYAEARTQLVSILAEACGVNGMTGGQAMDIAGEGQKLEPAVIEHMYRLKTGRLLRACVLSAASCPPAADNATVNSLEQYIDAIGLAFQIRDDILDIEGTTEQIGKPQGADIAHDKSTYCAVCGIETARERVAELHNLALSALDDINKDAEGLRWIANLIVSRDT